MLILTFKGHITPKKNAFRAGVSSSGRLFQYRRKDAITSQESLSFQAMVQARKQGWKLTDKPVRIRVMMKKTRADAVGVLETILDALENIAYKNDKQVVNCHYSWEDLEEGITAKLFLEEL